MVRRLFRLFVVLSVVAVLAVIATFVLTNTDFGRERARRFVLGILQGQTHGIVQVGSMHGNLLSGSTLVKVSIADSAGRPFLKADSITLRYVLRNFLSSRLDFDDVVLYHPIVVVARYPDGEWNYKTLWPSTPKTPGDTTHGWGAWATLTNVTLVNGFVTIRSPWMPRAGVSAHVRDSLIKDALGAGSRLNIAEVPGGYQKVVTLERVNAKVPLVRWADPDFATRYVKVASLNMDAFPFRPPAARVTSLIGNFEFNDDSLWWKGAAAKLPKSSLKADGVYYLNTGDLKLSLAAAPASFDDFHWLYEEFPKDGGGNLALLVQWKGTTQDYFLREADVRTGTAHLLGDVGVTLADTVFFHDADVRFTGLTTKLIETVAPGNESPRPGVLSGRAKFSGTLKRLDIASSDMTFDAYNRGQSRLMADGIVGFRGTKKVVVSASNLHVRLAPLQIDIVKLLFPLLPIGGTLSGVATLNGSGDRQLNATGLDIVHEDGQNVSHAVGSASVHTTGRQTMDLDVRARPFALAELTKFAPTLPLKGVAFGPVTAHGPIDSLEVDTKLALPGGGQFAMRGTVDFLSKELGYDVVADVTRLDLSWVVLFGPRTSLNGTGHAAGRGFKPATMYSDVSLDLVSSSLDTIAVDSISVRAKLANGLANIERARVLGSGATLDVSGQIGLDSTYAGALSYALSVDTLEKFARFIPGAVKPAPDSAVQRPRPRVAFEARRRARADSARTARRTEVLRAIANLPPVTLRVPSDTPTAIPKNLLEGSLKAKGTITGSIDRFNLEGDASGTALIVQGNSAAHVEATYSWIDATTKSSKVTASIRADTVSALGFAFDNVSADFTYLAPNGTMKIGVRQGTQRDYSLEGDFTLDKDRNELRLKDVALRFDSTTWKSTRASSVRFGAAGIEVVNLELTSGPGRRIFANGLLPTKGTANFDLEVTDFAVENVAELLQSDLPVTGRLSLDAHVSGTSEDPQIAGKVEFVRGTYNEATVPEVHGTFSYANNQLTTDAAATDTAGKTLASIKGTVPINLALSGVTGSRLLDLPVNAKLMSDSLPLGLIPQFTDAVSDIGGRALGNVSVGGTLKKPSLEGSMTLSDVHFRIVKTGAYFEHVNGAVRMTGDTVFVDSIAGVAVGPVSMSGTVAVGNWREPALNLDLRTNGARLLNNETGEVYTDVALQVSGPVTSPNVHGSVTVDHGVLFIPTARGKKVIGAGDPSLFSVVDTAIKIQAELFPAESPLFRNLRMDVDVNVLRNTWVRSRDANVEVFTDGPMQMKVVGDALTLTGVIDADRGEYTFLSKRFQIKRGSALFIGTPDLNPTLQITAEYQVKQPGGVTNIRVLVGGTLETPRISLESDAQPPLSQSDLLSYLAFGDKSSTLLQFNQTSLSASSGGNLLNVAGSRLAGIAIGVALDEVKGSAARSLGVDVFNITPGDIPVFASNGGAFLKATEIEVGRYVNPRTFVSVVSTIGGAPPGASLTHRTAKGLRFELSYSPRYILATPTLAGQVYSPTGQFGAFIIREWRF
ncbi:MAG: translocation/assembly module TamB domain-containing protein [bacterium]